MIEEAQAGTNTSENILEVDFQPAENVIMEEPIAANERYFQLLIGELLISFDKTSEEENSFDESIDKHSIVPLSP